jgi:hypothetical protein
LLQKEIADINKQFDNNTGEFKKEHEATLPLIRKHQKKLKARQSVILDSLHASQFLAPNLAQKASQAERRKLAKNKEQQSQMERYKQLNVANETLSNKFAIKSSLSSQKERILKIKIRRADL